MKIIVPKNWIKKQIKNLKKDKKNLIKYLKNNTYEEVKK